MGDCRLSSESHRRRRAPNELVWTQPRTIPASLHKNARRPSPRLSPRLSPLPAEPSTKNGKARKHPAQQTWPQGRVPRSLTPSSQAKDVLDWNDSDLLDFTGTCDMTDDAAVVQNPMNSSSSALDAPYLHTPQSMDQQSYPLHVEASYIEGLVSTLADDITDDSNSYMHAAPDSSMNPNGLNGFSAIHLAAHSGKFSVIQLLLSACPEALDLLNNDGETPLHIAVSEGHVDVVLELLRSGADALLQDADRRTPLHLAVLKEHLDIIRLLLDGTNGQAMVRLADYAGKTPLHQAVLQGSSQIIQLLLDKGADPRMPVSKTIRANI